ncbi:alpha/beta hydrolase [Streptomyces sp. WZ-12]|uniref:alpha/beta hydrolase n=1 Tax=Streptomyces sp. WZ-12 TaxID=3030210 RepID=UPI002381587E|nr:alpha/beta hydrolase [Streptomyces sp. WZ-12]
MTMSPSKKSQQEPRTSGGSQRSSGEKKKERRRPSLSDAQKAQVVRAVVAAQYPMGVSGGPEGPGVWRGFAGVVSGGFGGLDQECRDRMWGDMGRALLGGKSVVPKRVLPREGVSRLVKGVRKAPEMGETLAREAGPEGGGLRIGLGGAAGRPELTVEDPGDSPEGRRKEAAGYLWRALGEVDAGVPASVLSYDPSFGGVGRMAVAVGPIESARYVVVLVPGMGSAPENFHELVRSACNVRRACLKEIQVEDTGAGKVPVAVVAWQGYKAPRNLWAVKGEVSNEALAQAGSQLLNLDLAQWRALWRGDAAVRAGKGLPEQPVITVVGYSYGSVVAGHAMMKPVPGGTSVTAAARAAVTGAVKGAGAEAVGYSVVGPAAKSWQAGGGAAEIAVEAAKSAARVGTTAADIAAGGGVGTAMDAAKTIGARTLAAAHEAYYRQPVGGGNADYLVLLGSPGTGRRARHLNIPASHIYTGANKEDIVSKLNWFSIDPTHMKYGDVTRIRTEDEDFPVTGPVAPHTAYYTPGSESLRNIARIALGTPEKVTTKPQRSGFVLEGHRSLLGRLFTSPSDTPRPGQPPTTTRRVGTGYLKADTVNGAPALVRSNKSHPRYSGMRSSGADGIHHTLGGASFFTPDWMDITFHNGVPRITTASPLPEGYLSDLVCVTTISPGHTTTVSTEHFTDDPERDHTVYLPLDLTPHTLTVISPISNQHQNLWKTPGLLNIPDIIKTLVKNAVPALPDLTPLSIPGSADIFPLTGFAAPLLLTQQQLEAAEKVLRVLEPALVQAPSGTELAEPQETFINIRELVRIIEKATGKEKEGLVQGLMMGEGIGLARIIEKAAGTEKKEFTQRPAAGMETAPARPYQGERISLNGTSYLDLPDTVSLATEFSGKILQITGQPDTHDTTIEYNITLNWHHHGTYHLGTIPADGQPHTINLHAQTHATFYEIMQPTTGDIEVTPTLSVEDIRPSLASLTRTAFFTATPESLGEVSNKTSGTIEYVALAERGSAAALRLHRTHSLLSEFLIESILGAHTSAYWNVDKDGYITLGEKSKATQFLVRAFENSKFSGDQALASGKQFELVDLSERKVVTHSGSWLKMGPVINTPSLFFKARLIMPMMGISFTGITVPVAMTDAPAGTTVHIPRKGNTVTVTIPPSPDQKQYQIMVRYRPYDDRSKRVEPDRYELNQELKYVKSGSSETLTLSDVRNNDESFDEGSSFSLYSPDMVATDKYWKLKRQVREQRTRISSVPEVTRSGPINWVYLAHARAVDWNARPSAEATASREKYRQWKRDLFYKLQTTFVGWSDENVAHGGGLEIEARRGAGVAFALNDPPTSFIYLPPYGEFKKEAGGSAQVKCPPPLSEAGDRLPILAIFQRDPDATTSLIDVISMDDKWHQLSIDLDRVAQKSATIISAIVTTQSEKSSLPGGVKGKRLEPYPSLADLPERPRSKRAAVREAASDKYFEDLKKDFPELDEATLDYRGIARSADPILGLIKSQLTIPPVTVEGPALPQDHRELLTAAKDAQAAANKLRVALEDLDEAVRRFAPFYAQTVEGPPSRERLSSKERIQLKDEIMRFAERYRNSPVPDEVRKGFGRWGTSQDRHWEAAKRRYAETKPIADREFRSSEHLRKRVRDAQAALGGVPEVMPQPAPTGPGMNTFFSLTFTLLSGANLLLSVYGNILLPAGTGDFRVQGEWGDEVVAALSSVAVAVPFVQNVQELFGDEFKAEFTGKLAPFISAVANAASLLNNVIKGDWKAAGFDIMGLIADVAGIVGLFSSTLAAVAGPVGVAMALPGVADMLYQWGKRAQVPSQFVSNLGEKLTEIHRKALGDERVTYHQKQYKAGTSSTEIARLWHTTAEAVSSGVIVQGLLKMDLPAIIPKELSQYSKDEISADLLKAVPFEHSDPFVTTRNPSDELVNDLYKELTAYCIKKMKAATASERARLKASDFSLSEWLLTDKGVQWKVRYENYRKREVPTD